MSTDFQPDRVKRRLPKFAAIRSEPRRGVVSPASGGAESDLSDYWASFKATGKRYEAFLLTRPVASLRAFRNIFRLPVIDAWLSENPQGTAIKSGLSRRLLKGAVTIAATGVCVLDVPKRPGDYSLGSARQTLRRKTRAAISAGATWRAVEDPAEQRRLIEVLDDSLKRKSDPRYRESNSDHRHLIGHGMWTVAFSDDGEPLLIAVTPVDGEWGLLTAFLTLGDTKLHSDARYYLTQIVVDRLAARGVRYLADTRSPFELENGLRHFQRILGFRIARVRFRVWSPQRTAPAWLSLMGC